ncbi:MAG TPA: alpha/beta hydrolase [Vicinamibacterales bacterium]
MTRATVRGIELDYESLGDVSAPAILLIMGLAMPGVAWPDAFVDGLVAAGFRVVRFDNRDCGGSSIVAGGRLPNLRIAVARALLRRPVTAPYTLDDMAADTVGLLDALGIDRAHVVGVSMGGMIAQNVAALYPQRVASLTSIMSSAGNPSLRVSMGKPRALRAILSRPLSTTDIESLVEHYARVFGAIGSPGFAVDGELLRRDLRRIVNRGIHPAGTVRQLLAILASGDRRPLLARISAPTLVVHGSDDPLVPVAAGRDTAFHIPGARLEIIKGMGHDLPPGVQSFLVERIIEHCRGAIHAAGS